MATLDSSLHGIGQKRRRGLSAWACLDWKQWARAILSIRATPKQIALGVAVGSFIAFTPLIGLQTLLAALFAALIGASKKAAMLAVWISNPLTMGPIFAVTYQLGVVLGSPAPAVASTPGSLSAAPMASTDLVASTPYSLEGLMQAGWGYILPMFLGGAVIGLLAAFVAFHLTHRSALAYQKAQARRRSDRV